jgi:hypothetical protein
MSADFVIRFGRLARAIGTASSYGVRKNRNDYTFVSVLKITKLISRIHLKEETQNKNVQSLVLRDNNHPAVHDQSGLLWHVLDPQ